MKINFYSLWVLFLLGSISLISCKKYLNTQPLDTYTSNGISSQDTEDLYTTASDAQNLLNNVYKHPQNDWDEYFTFGRFMMMDVTTENSFAGSNEAQDVSLDMTTWNSTNGRISAAFNSLYSSISECNVAIKYLPTIADEVYTNAGLDKNAMIAQAKAFRAYCYFEAVQNWGEIPVVLEPTPSVTAQNLAEVYHIFYPPTKPIDSIYAQILKDLHEALPTAPAIDADKSKMTKGTIHGLLAKIFATYAHLTPEGLNLTAEKCYDSCIYYANSVTNDGYTLVATFDDLWNATSQVKNSSESLLEIPFNSSRNNKAYYMFLGNSDGGAEGVKPEWQKFMTPTKNLVDAYTIEGDKTRQDASILTKEAGYSTYWPSNAYKFQRKMRSSSNNILLLRYADILLIEAEAKAYKGDLAGATALINQVRARVSLANISSPASVDAAIDAILNERLLEFAFEGNRWHDLVRNGKAAQVMSKATDQIGNRVYSIPDYRLLFPFPQTQLDLNSNLKQNEGY